MMIWLECVSKPRGLAPFNTTSPKSNNNKRLVKPLGYNCVYLL